MTTRWKNRTSLFARMSLLFGLLVTVPLVFSGIVLSLAGQKVVLEGGDRVAGIGRMAVGDAAARFNDVAVVSLREATTSIAKVGKQRLQDTSAEAVKAGRSAVISNTGLVTVRGQVAVGDATKAMVNVADATVEDSVRDLRTLNKEALTHLSEDFQTEMRRELNRSSQPIRDDLYNSVKESWQLSADARALSVRDYVSRSVNDLRLRMEYPLRTQPIINANDEKTALVPLGRIRKPGGSSPEVARAVLVNYLGTEIARQPQTDLQEGEDGDDWTDSPIRARLLRSQSALVEEPVRYDQRRKFWVLRIAHKITEGDSAADPDTSEQMMLLGEPRPTHFLVVDLSLERVAELATSDRVKPGMLVMVVNPDLDAGNLLSIHPRRPDGSAAPIIAAVVERLKQGRAGGEPEKAQLAFNLRTGDIGWQAVARHWGREDKCWTVVVQPESEVFTPVARLEDGIRNAWGNSLGRVNATMGGFITDRSARADKRRLLLARGARKRLDAARDTQTNRVANELTEYRAGLVKGLERSLAGATLKLKEQADRGMDTEAARLAATAARDFTARSTKQADATSTQIAQQARGVANQAAGQMFLNSAWLIPLFLVLALFLATLTARSLVRPINQLVKGTQALAAGEYNQRIKVQGDNELSRLALAFNNMAGAIQTGQGELRQSHSSLAAEKARIEGIVEASPDGLVVLEPGGQVALMNPTAVRLLGVVETDVPVAPFEIGRLPEAAAHRLRDCLERVQAGEGVREYETDEPERRVLQLREVTLSAADGRSFGHLLHLHDITRERVIDEMKSDFISLVSHELRTPLTSILGFSSYMLTGRLGEVKETQRTALESIHRQAKRLTAIIADFLDVSRIESGKIEMKKEEVAVAQVAGRVIEDLRPQALEKSIHVAAEAADGSLPLLALGDEQRIVQVFTNLVGNSLKFTEAGGSIDVLLSRQNGEVVCRVRDSGCGIPPDELERVFDRFYQVEKVVTRKSGGTGLGLAIVKNIVEAHGGRIWIDSQIGRGTEVSFTLPGAE